MVGSCHKFYSLGGDYPPDCECAMITNKFNLPEALYRAILNDPYKKVSDFTASELPVPVQIRALRNRYSDEIKQDATELIFPLIGNNVHHIIERVDLKNALQEERFQTTIQGFTLSGQIDLYEHPILWDFKVTTRFVLIDGAKPDWIAQSNVNAWLMKTYKFNVEQIKIGAIFRDWSKIQALRDKDYPQRQVAVLPMPLWKEEDTYEWIKERITEHIAADITPDEKLPECTPEERWEKPTTYAVKKGKNKRAVRVLPSLEDAEDYIIKNISETIGSNRQYWIEERPGQSTRCEYYCEVKDFCQQYKRMKEA